MTAALADTHAAIWYLNNDPRLSTRARNTLDAAGAASQFVAVSSISLIEMIYLMEKSRIPSDSYARLKQALSDHRHAFYEAAVTVQVSDSLALISRDEVPDMPDRIIAATALHLNVPVISRDRRIRATNLVSIW